LFDSNYTDISSANFSWVWLSGEFIEFGIASLAQRRFLSRAMELQPPDLHYSYHFEHAILGITVNIFGFVHFLVAMKLLIALIITFI
jgi:hypothetical protein